MSFTVVSTFSGCGGSCLGYKRAGGRVLFAADFDENAVNTYQVNWPDTALYHGDVSYLSVDEIFKETRLKKGELDIFDGSPPCQGFSTAGKRQMTDSRNQLFKEYCRLLVGLQPKCFIMENVSGMIKGNMKFIFVEVLKSLKECGYRVKAKLLNAKNFGVPQSRERLIFIGIREDLKIEPSFPEKNKKIITFKDAVLDCIEGERKEPKGFIAEIANKLKPGENCSIYHPKKHCFSSFRINPNMPAPTITKTFGASRSFVMHPFINMSLSIEEVKRLFTFPDDYIFMGKFEQKWARLGNCVPPDFMKAIATHVYENVLKRVNSV